MKRNLLVIFFAFIACEFAYPQKPANELAEKPITKSGVVYISRPAVTASCGNKVGVESSNIRVKISYDPAKDVRLKFILKAFNSKGEVVQGCFNNDTYELVVSAKKPEAVFEYNLKKFIINGELDVESVQITPVNTGSVDAAILFEVEYAQSVFFKNPTGLKIPSLFASKPVVDIKNVNLEWECIYPFTKYQIEILKLENVNSLIRNDSVIKAEIDWNKAISIDYDVASVLDANGKVITRHNFSTSINQGTGYYTWRVRPIGSYFESGVGNSKNWGEWSKYDVGAKDLVKSNLDISYFYYNDPNQNLNYSNSKIFTEDNKVKEVQTFADGLNNVRQTRTHLASTNTTIAVQNVNDFNGRQSIQSLPIPIKDERKKYSPILLSGNAEYSAANFDRSDKPYADKVDNNDVVSYYEGNANQNVPESELIPFSQTKYYDDPLGRVKQEGGPGEIMRINALDKAKNKNKKYLYGVASESELVRLFGDKTPLPNTVNKVIQEDANGVSTISYLGQGEKVLATCLSFSDKNTSPASLQKLDKIENGGFEQVHVLDNNEMHEWGYSCSKRFVILADSTDVRIDYSVDNPSLFADCARLNVDCNYGLEIALFKVDEKNSSRELKSYSLAKITNETKGLAEPVVKTLSKGTYIVEKRLLLGEPTVNTEQIAKDVAMLVKPMPELTKSLLYNVTCKSKIPEFQSKLKEIRQSFRNKDLSRLKQVISSSLLTSTLKDSVAIFMERYDKEVNKEGFSYELFYKDGKIYRVLPENSTANADLVEMKTPCCRVIVPVRWIRRFDTNQYPYIKSSEAGELAKPKDVIEVEDRDEEYDYMPDFEGYAIAYFRDCDALNGTDGSFRQYMGGWEQPGIFNYMVYHMLTDKLKPYVDNSIVEQQKEKGAIASVESNENQKAAYDCKGNLIDDSWLNGVYDTKKLFNCWENQLKILASAKGCSNYLLETDFDKKVNIAEKFDEQMNNDKSVFNKAIDKVYRNMSFIGKVGLGFGGKRKLRRKISKKIRAVSAKPEDEGVNVNVDTFEGNIVKGFLDCAGYSFAKIISPYDAKPLAEDLDSKFDYEEPNDVRPFKYKLVQGSLIKDYFTVISKHRRENTQINSKLKRPDVDFAYVPLADWRATSVGKDGKPGDKHLLPRIKNPIYAFKYFEYAEEGFKETQEVETNHCYTDPNDCYSLDGDNFYARDDINGGFKKVSCCGVNSSNSICYTDFNYPNIDLLYKPNDPRFTISGDKKARYIVSNFDGNGRMKCPYDHISWSRGQRLTFYNLLNKLYPNGIDPNLEKQKEKDEEDYLGYEGDTEVKRDCNFLKTPREWYILPDEDGDISSEYPALIPDIEKEDYPDAKEMYAFTMPDGSKKTTVSSIEMIIRDKEKESLDGCERRFSQFREEIIKMLEKNCYLIDQCRGKGEAYDHIVSSAEIDEMAKALVKNCRAQCYANTFSCSMVDLYRGVKDPKGLLGGKPNGVKVYYGIGGMPANDPRSKNYKDGALDAVVNSQVPGSSLIEYDLSKYNEDDFSWYEYTALEQAKSWNFEINLPCKCSTLSLFPQRASEVYMAVRTPKGVEKFSNGDFVRFDDVDFGKGFDNISIDLKKMYDGAMDGAPFKVRLYLDGNMQGEIVLNGSSLSMDFPSPISGIHSLKIEGVGGSSVNCLLGVVKLSAKNVTDKSNSREFAPAYPNNFIPKEKYENYKSAIPDYNNPAAGKEDVETPAKKIQVEYDNDKKRVVK